MPRSCAAAIRRSSVGQRAEQRVDVAVVADVVAEVRHRRAVERRDPDRVDAQPRQVIEPALDARRGRRCRRRSCRGTTAGTSDRRLHRATRERVRHPSCGVVPLEATLRTPADSPSGAWGTSTVCSRISGTRTPSSTALNVETFMDGNGDGCGDFEGLSRRLDYLESLGVDALWLAPFQPTPLRDDGYDISDYYNVARGSAHLGDYVEFMRQAESRGIRVIIDLVVNHTSDRHPWFRTARESRDAPTRDWYVWSAKRPPNWRIGHRLPRRPARHLDARSEGARVVLPPLLRLPARPEHAEPARARRAAADHGLLAAAGRRRLPRRRACRSCSRSHRSTAGRPSTDFELLHQIRDMVQWRRGDAVLLAEANVLPDQNGQYFADGDGVHMMFNFWVNQHLFCVAGDGRCAAAGAGTARRRGRCRQGAQWAHFLRNHDELDLGRLSTMTSAVRYSTSSAPSRQCSSTTAASAAGWRRCSATAGGSSWPTACCSRCPERRCCATATRSAWATTSRLRGADGDPYPDAVVGGTPRRLLDAPSARFCR